MIAEKKFSIIICIYNCTMKDLLYTTKSIINQKNIEFEIIFADDCSSKIYSTELQNFLSKQDFLNYIYIKNKKNLGTVKNILNAVSKCNGNYIKVIGAGDILYDCFTLSNVYNYMVQNDYQICFGKAKCYQIKNKKIKITRFNTPYSVKPYIKQDYYRIKRNLVIYGDQISGSVTFHSKEILLEYLNKLKDKVIYVEDYIPRLIVLDDKKIGYLNKYVLTYQYGTGISTSLSEKSNKRMDKDEESFTKLVKDYKKDNIFIEKYLKFYKIKNSNSILRLLKKIQISPAYLCYYTKSYTIKKINFLLWKSSKKNIQ